jgi:hypothetical protein
MVLKLSRSRNKEELEAMAREIATGPSLTRAEGNDSECCWVIYMGGKDAAFARIVGTERRGSTLKILSPSLLGEKTVTTWNWDTKTKEYRESIVSDSRLVSRWDWVGVEESELPLFKG